MRPCACDSIGCVRPAVYQLLVTHDEAIARLEVLVCDEHLADGRELVERTCAHFDDPDWYVRVSALLCDLDVLRN